VSVAAVGPNSQGECITTCSIQGNARMGLPGGKRRDWLDKDNLLPNRVRRERRVRAVKGSSVQKLEKKPTAAVHKKREVSG